MNTKRSVKCPCPKQCGNYIDREDGMIKHSWHINARWNHNCDRLECPVSLSIGEIYDSNKTNNKHIIREIDI